MHHSTLLAALALTLLIVACIGASEPRADVLRASPTAPLEPDVEPMIAAPESPVATPAESAPGESSDSPVSRRGADTRPTDPIDAGRAAAIAATHEEVAFPSWAFPPTLPPDSSHERAWLRTDCILCHETGIGGAPIVQHAGMSRALLEARCRTCHVAAPPNEPGQVAFARRAFPPTLPTDGAHAGAWMREDCLACHQAGIQGAPRIVHQGMTTQLLAARCRTCHVPRAPASDTPGG